MEAESFEKDLQYFKEKVEAGADFAVTQLFYDNQKYFDFMDRCKEMGIPETFDVFPGIMPIQNYGGFKRMTGFCKTYIPAELEAALEPIQNDDAAVKAFGIELGVKMSRELLDRGCPGVHLYTLNLETSATAIIKDLGLLRAQSPREYPFNRSTGSRNTETTRPIFWAQRPRSYVERTQAWDDFPNGRFGNRESPAYGLFALPPKPTDKQVEELREQWQFTDEAGLRELFGNFLLPATGVKQLPWCPECPGEETVCIRSQLVRLCKQGFLTINSQPRVNGALSTDPLFGWGPAGGVVYQKAYAEFFCSPAHFQALQKELADQSAIEVMAATRDGKLIHSGASPVTAVTWGVFPGQEIQQPTVVDATSFDAWKQEAFALWDKFTEVMPEENTEARSLVKEIKDTWVLCNLVDNNFLSGDLFTSMGQISIGAAQKQRGA